jgi:mannose-6-phosphate isomerase-like protein (cupin superfamily)
MSAMTGFGEHVPMSLGADEGEAIWYLGGLMTRKTGAEATAGAFDVIETLAAPGASPPWHVHHREDESFYVVEGRVTYYVGERVISAEHGTFVRLPRGIAHTFRIEGTEPARLLEIVAPSGLWEFFKEMGEPARERVLPPLQPPDPAKLRSVSARYGIEILGPFKG